MLVFDFLKLAYDQARGRPNTAFPTWYHYIEICRDELAARGIDLSRFGQHCLRLRHRDSEAELIVVVRYTSDRDLKLLEQQAARPNVRIAYLLDDDLWAMVEDRKLRSSYRAKMDYFLEGYFARLRPMIDEFVAPNRQILARIPELPGTFMPPAHLAPSGDLEHFDKPDRINMVFLGTSTHASDFSRVAPAIATALAGNPHLHLTTLLGKRGAKAIPAGPQVAHLGNMFFRRFQTWLANQRFHIALAPYGVNEVNNGRSNLKVHQHSLVGAAGLYTGTTPFLETIEDGVDGLLLDATPEIWAQTISDLAVSPDRMRSLAAGGIAKCLEVGSREAIADQWLGLLRPGHKC